MAGTQPAPSAALLKIMGGTLAQPFFATPLEITTNKQSACHLTSTYAVMRAGGSSDAACSGVRTLRIAPRHCTSAYGSSGMCTKRKQPAAFPPPR
jgi:hypothetical protein